MLKIFGTMIQKGRNYNFPESIQIWRKGEKVPEWLSDRACITSIDMKLGYNLKYRNTTTGGYEILDSSGIDVLVRSKNIDDYICLGDNGKIFSLSPKQLNLLYKNER